MDISAQKVVLNLIKSGEIVNAEKAEKLRDNWEKTKEKLKAEVRLLKNESRRRNTLRN